MMRTKLVQEIADPKQRKFLYELRDKLAKRERVKGALKKVNKNHGESLKSLGDGK